VVAPESALRRVADCALRALPRAEACGTHGGSAERKPRESSPAQLMTVGIVIASLL
jgi:hypothetical protein